MFTKGIKDNYSVLAYDFSRAWTYHGWPIPQLPMITCNTITVFRQWKQVNPFDAVAACTLLDKIETIGAPLIQDIYRKMPSQWLLKTEVNAIVKWWAQGGRAARINQIREGIKNGSFI